MAEVKPRRSWARRLARGVAWTLAWTLTGILALLVLVLACLNLGPVRELVRKQVNAGLATTFRGTLDIERIGYIHVGAVASLGGIDARMLDEHRKRVISVHGVSAVSPWPSIVWDLVRSRPLTVTISDVHADHIEIILIDDGQGSPTLASAFAPREPSPKTEPSGPGVTVLLPEIRARHVWGHGDLSALPGIDVELKALAASLSSRPEALSIGLAEVTLLSRNLPSSANPNGRLRASLTLPSKDSDKPKVSADFDGTLIGAKMTLNAKLEDGRVAAKLSAPAIPAEALHERVPALAPSGPTALQFEANGTLPRVDVTARLTNAAVGVELTGHVSLEETLNASADVKVSKLNAQGLVATAPVTELDANFHATLSMPKSGPLSAEYRLEVPSGRVQAERTPGLVLEGKLSREPEGELATDGTLNVSEQGLSALAQYRFQLTRDGKQLLNVKLAAELANSPRLERVSGVRTSARLEAFADLDLGQKLVSAKVLLSAAPVVQGSNRIKSIDFRATAKGPLTAPALNFELLANEISAADQQFSLVDVSGRGTPERLTVHARIVRPPPAGEIELDTTLVAGEAFALLTPSGKLKTKEGDITLRVAKVTFPGGAVKIDRFEVDGAGTLAGSARVGGGRVEADLSAKDVDLGKLVRLARIDVPLKRGFFSAEARVSGTLRRLRGKIQASARELELPHAKDGKLDIDLNIEDQKTSGSVAATFGNSEVNVEIEELALPLENAASATLQDFKGKLEVKGSLELTQVLPFLRAAGVPLEDAKGKVKLELSADNPRGPGSRPTLSVRVKTSQLKLVEQREKPNDAIESTAEAKRVQPRSLVGVAVEASLAYDGQSGQTELGAKLTDARGVLVDATLETRLQEFTQEGFARSLATLPIRAKLRVPERELSHLPSILRPASTHGRFALDLEADGSISDPRLTARGKLSALKTRDEQRGLDATLDVEYASKGGRIALTASALKRKGGASRGKGSSQDSPRERTKVLDLTSSWEGNLLAKVRGDPGASLDLDAELALDRFPLGYIQSVGDRGVRGPLSCKVLLTDLGKNAKLEASVDGRGLKVAEIQLKKFDVAAKTEADQLRVDVDLGDRDGSLAVDLTTAMKWGAELAPTIDPHAKIKVEARRFPLATASPLLLDYVSSIEGGLDANLTVELGDGPPKMQGTAAINDGIVQVPQIGQRFASVSAKVSVDPSGRIKLDSMEARGTSGRISVNGEATIKDAGLESLKLHAQIQKKEKLPLTYEGVELGDAWGKIDFTLENQNGSSEMRVDVPALTLQLPAALANVQDLASDEHVRVGVYQRDGKFRAVAAQPLKVSGSSSDSSGEEPSKSRLRVRLGDSVWIERGTDMKAQLTGEMLVISGEESRIEGRIELRGGKLDVNGKTFDIETGVVSFDDGTADNPTITATARWDAPGYSVYAQYAGTVKAGKLTLRSEPPLTQAQIVSLLLFGDPEGAVGGGEAKGTAAATAFGVAGGSAVKGFNRVMSDFTHLDVSARIDTSTGAARPELVMQVTPALTTKVARVLGEPTQSQGPDKTFLTLELRLKRAWAVSATVGDRGSSVLDLIWRKRY